MYMFRTCSSRCHKEAIPVWDTITCNYIHTYLYILQLTAPTMDSNPHKEDEPTNNTKAEACSPDHESQPKEGSMFCALVLYSNIL